MPTFARPRGLPPAPAALGDGRADEPVHVALDRRRRRATGPRSSTSCSSTTAARASCADEVGRQALHCIRCSACLNVCPVYSRTGGHAYGSVYPGPIGAILTPAAPRDRERQPRSRSPRASAAPATRSARSRSTSRRCCSTFARRRSKQQRRGASGSRSDCSDGSSHALGAFVAHSPSRDSPGRSLDAAASGGSRRRSPDGRGAVTFAHPRARRSRRGGTVGEQRARGRPGARPGRDLRSRSDFRRPGVPPGRGTRARRSRGSVLRDGSRITAPTSAARRRTGSAQA